MFYKLFLGHTHYTVVIRPNKNPDSSLGFKYSDVVQYNMYFVLCRPFHLVPSVRVCVTLPTNIYIYIYINIIHYIYKQEQKIHFLVLQQ